MFRSFARVVRGKLTPTRPFFIGVTITTTIITFKNRPTTIKLPPYFTFNLSPPPRPNFRPRDNPQRPPEWNVTNYFFSFPCAGMALYYWLYEKGANHMDIPYEKDETSPAAYCLQRLTAIGINPRLFDGFVSIEYAIDRLVRVVNTDMSRIWGKFLILAELSQRLSIIRCGDTYICKKNLVDRMDWQAWWERVNRDD